mmetsp:Transcript_3213/g.4687  ORF Transcript_3213/g.4687 Transcript_3213/m.4687 type:complete len:132 (+) Transcript_3213:397-792(+)
MWADAKLLPIPGFNRLSQIDPLRWSQGSPKEIITELSSPKYRNIDRPVLLRVKNQTHSLTFENPLSAVEWIQTCQEGVPSNSTATSNTISALSHLAAPALGLFCRLHSSRPWRERNLLITTAYAKLCGSCS